MTLTMGSMFTSLALIALTAGGYAIATAGMKMTSMFGMTAQALAVITGGLLMATLAEIVLLRGAQLAVIYVAIIAAETIFVLFLASLLGDRVTAQQLIGAGLVLGGVVLVSH